MSEASKLLTAIRWERVRHSDNAEASLLERGGFQKCRPMSNQSSVQRPGPLHKWIVRRWKSASMLARTSTPILANGARSSASSARVCSC